MYTLSLVYFSPRLPFWTRNVKGEFWDGCPSDKSVTQLFELCFQNSKLSVCFMFIFFSSFFLTWHNFGPNNYHHKWRKMSTAHFFKDGFINEQLVSERWNPTWSLILYPGMIHRFFLVPVVLTRKRAWEQTIWQGLKASKLISAPPLLSEREFYDTVIGINKSKI